MIKHLKCYMASFMIFLGVTFPQAIQAMEIKGDEAKTLQLFPSLVLDLGKKIIEEVVSHDCYEVGHATHLALVCQDWHTFIKKNQPLPTDKFYKTPHNLEESCLIKIFMNSELMFQPDPNSNEGIIRFKISDLDTPLEGTFDLSQCGVAGTFLNISTGYRQDTLAENKGKAEIWLVLRFMIKNALKEGRAQYFKDIFHEWNPNALYGIFWTWGGSNDLTMYDCLLNKELLASSKNLYDCWKIARLTLRPPALLSLHETSSYFLLHILPVFSNTFQYQP